MWRRVADGLVLTVRVTPRAGADALDGPETRADGRRVLAVRVRAAPDKGAANGAVAALVARAFGVPKSAVTLTSGATGRIKTLKIDGAPDALETLARELDG